MHAKLNFYLCFPAKKLILIFNLKPAQLLAVFYWGGGGHFQRENTAKNLAAFYRWSQKNLPAVLK